MYMYTTCNFVFYYIQEYTLEALRLLWLACIDWNCWQRYYLSFQKFHKPPIHLVSPWDWTAHLAPTPTWVWENASFQYNVWNTYMSLYIIITYTVECLPKVNTSVWLSCAAYYNESPFVIVHLRLWIILTSWTVSYHYSRIMLFFCAKLLTYTLSSIHVKDRPVKSSQEIDEKWRLLPLNGIYRKSTLCYRRL